MRIVLGADQRGRGMRDVVAAVLQRLGHEFDDLGIEEEEAEYPDVAATAGRKVNEGDADRAILVGRTGMGMCVVANKFPGVRAVNCHDAILAEMSRRTMDANVLCLSADLLSPHVIETMVETWLSATFEHGRHALRLQKVAAVELEVLSRYKEHLLGTA